MCCICLLEYRTSVWTIGCEPHYQLHSCLPLLDHCLSDLQALVFFWNKTVFTTASYVLKPDIKWLSIMSLIVETESDL